MDNNKLNRWLSLIATSGVLIGIILVIVELDMNRDMMRAQTRNEIASGVLELLSSWYENPEVVDVIIKSNRGEELTASESFIATARSEAFFRYFENVHYQYRQGMYDEVEYSTHLVTMRRIIDSQKALSRYWCNSSPMFSPPFAAETESMVDKSVCD